MDASTVDASTVDVSAVDASAVDSACGSSPALPSTWTWTGAAEAGPSAADGGAVCLPAKGPEGWQPILTNSVVGYLRADGVNAVMYVAPNQHLTELSLSGATWSRVDLFDIAGAPPAASAIAGYSQLGCVTALVFRATNGHIWQVTAQAGMVWQAEDLSCAAGAPLAVGDPAAYVRADGFAAVVYRGANGHVYELRSGSTALTWADLTEAAGAPSAQGDPAAYVRSDNASAVVFAATGGDIDELLLAGTPASWGLTDLTAEANAGTATDGLPDAGPPAGVLRPWVRSDGFNSVLFRDMTGRIGELFMDPQWLFNYPCIPCVPAPPTPASDPFPYIRADGTGDVVYRAVDGNIDEVFFFLAGGGWDWGSPSAVASASPASGAPSGYVRSDGLSAVPFRRASDGHVLELLLDPTTTTQWIQQDLTTLAGGPDAGP